MALLESEVQRIRFELGYNTLSVGAEPYISYHAVFDSVVRVYLNAGAKTTSSTVVLASTTAAPSPLTLASPIGFAAGAVVVVDVDDRQERATIQSVSGSAITVLLKKAHTGTYPVTVEGGEAIVRGILEHLYSIATKIGTAIGTAGLKRVEDIEFFGGFGAQSQLGSLKSFQVHWRDELASALGVVNLWRVRNNAGGQFELY